MLSNWQRATAWVVPLAIAVVAALPSTRVGVFFGGPVVWLVAGTAATVAGGAFATAVVAFLADAGLDRLHHHPLTYAVGGCTGSGLAAVPGGFVATIVGGVSYVPSGAFGAVVAGVATYYVQRRPNAGAFSGRDSLVVYLGIQTGLLLVAMAVITLLVVPSLSR